jgi:flagellar biosynthesis protein FlhF
MRIKKYMAASMKEALLQIKQELGEDAMILKTRRIPRSIFALGAKDEVEVTAAVDDTINAPSLSPLKVRNPGVYGHNGARPAPRVPVGIAAEAVRQATPPPPPRPSRPTRMSMPVIPAEEDTAIVGIREDIRELRDTLKSILKTGETTAAGGFAGAWAVLYKRLIDAEIRPAVAEDLIRSVKGDSETPPRDVGKRFVEVLGQNFPVSGAITTEPDGPAIIAFVGPTGSGKTTTIAKLASYYSLYKQFNVSLLTADTYRIAAIDQIRTFADIMHIGLQVVFSPDEVRSALEECTKDDIVLVDTAGRSQRNADHMRELAKLLDWLKPDELHLVLSATTKDSDLADTIRRYDDLGVNRLVFTKLDETARLGNIFNTVSRSGIPVSYFTFGQSVPDDIELAQPGRFVQRLWEGSSL